MRSLFEWIFKSACFHAKPPRASRKDLLSLVICMIQSFFFLVFAWVLLFVKDFTLRSLRGFFFASLREKPSCTHNNGEPKNQSD